LDDAKYDLAVFYDTSDTIEMTSLEKKFFFGTIGNAIKSTTDSVKGEVISEKVKINMKKKKSSGRILHGRASVMKRHGHHKKARILHK
jgi:hypothetical protein